MRQPARPTTPDEPLVVRLRELRDRTGLSLAALAARTPYSKSAWHRYLTEGKRPPRSAVEALARIAGADPAPVLALWEASQGPPPSTDRHEGGAARPPRRRAVRLTVLTLLTAAAAAAVALTLTTRHGSSGTQFVMAAPRCHGRSCQGRLPDASVCARDARTESMVSDPSYDVRLRYSPTCGTVWSQVRLRSPHAREISVRAGQDMLSATYPAKDSTGDSSPMLTVPSPRGVEACAEVAGQLACTGLDVEEPDGSGDQP
ncbi:XRE family transcriptional regulator [Streptomyces sp. NPDC058964]|uniref:XRE family transcriptional regulator n=1 Tax=Streptomyces sp. NPDC058964 TaxID=3346681 RepID=UPI0036C4DE2D